LAILQIAGPVLLVRPLHLGQVAVEYITVTQVMTNHRVHVREFEGRELLDDLFGPVTLEVGRQDHFQRHPGRANAERAARLMIDPDRQGIGFQR
jgi:hypothetical protein